MMSAKTGIDKLCLSSREAAILKPGHKFKLKPGALSIQDNSTEFVSQDICIAKFTTGKPIVGQNLHYNSELANYDISSRGISIVFNSSKHKHSYHLAGIDAVADSIKEVQKEVRAAGLLMPFDTATIWRLDIARQCEMSQNFLNYSPVFAALRAKYSPDVSNRGTTFTIGNKSRQTQFYDKGVHLQQAFDISIPERNLMRCEARFLNGQVITKLFNDNGLMSILDTPQDKFDTVYRQHLKSRVLTSTAGEQMASNWTNELHLVQKIKSEYNRAGWFNYWLLSQGNIVEVLAKFGGWPNVVELFKAAGLSRLDVNRAKHQLHKLMSLPTVQQDEKTFKELYIELQTKFAA